MANNPAGTKLGAASPPIDQPRAFASAPPQRTHGAAPPLGPGGDSPRHCVDGPGKHWRNCGPRWWPISDYFQAHYELAQQLHLLGRRREAEGHFCAALTLRPTWADAHSNLEILLAQEGRLDEAIEHFRKDITLEPDQLAARMNLKRAETSAPRSSSMGHAPGTVFIDF